MHAPRHRHLDESWALLTALLDGRLGLDDVDARIAAGVLPALQARADGLLRQLGPDDDARSEQRVRTLVKELAHAGGAVVPFDRFRELVESELAGVVFTAHPTFALSGQANAFAHELVRESATGASSSREISQQPAAVRRSASPTLDEELEASLGAVRATRAAIRRLLRAAIDVAAELYPDDYRRMRPRFLTVATWVGFDLDGRTDIGWSKSLACRYRLALAGLAELAARLDALGVLGSKEPAQIRDPLAAIARGFDTLADCFRIGLEALGREAEDATRLGRLNRLALEKRALKQQAVEAIDAALETLLGRDLEETLCKELLVLRAEWEANGLGLARIHFRLNSAQLHNAIRPDIDLRGAPGRSASRRHYLAAITRLLEEVTSVNVHYGSVAREQTTAKRVFMLAAQFCKHFDARTPVRLLIAESDTPFTLLVALYYARLFGVERQVELSPLFETANGLHHGDRVIGELLDNPHFVAYIRAQCRFCVQLGFSDSGRYIGQPAATLAVERFKLRVLRLWKQRRLEDVQLVFFDTHGESIGRGAHPRGLADRFLYTHPHEVRRQAHELAVPHKHEVSFQGGEGYLWFASERTALAVAAGLLTARLAVEPARADALYAASGWALDFFLTLKEYQERLTAHPGYRELVNAIGRRLLYPTGSRALQRQAAGRGGGEVEHLAELRAIPNNAMLHQLAYLANSFGGLGLAASQSPDTFLALLEKSDRLERTVSLALAARARSDVTVFEAYVELMDPSYWLDRAGEGSDRDRNAALRHVARVLENTFRHDAMASFVRTLRRDAALLDDVLEEHSSSGAWSSSDALAQLHALRLALIQLIYVKATEIPQFSSRLEVSLDELIERLLHLDVPETVATLRRIFPAAPPGDDTDVYGERDTYTRAEPSGYAAEHARIFAPIERAYGQLLELSALIALHLGAYG